MTNFLPNLPMLDLVLSTPGSYKFWPIFNSDLTPSNIL